MKYYTFFIVVLIYFNSHSQLKIDNVNMFGTKFHFNNKSGWDLLYFNPECFYYKIVDKGKFIKVVLSRDRANLRNDTLFLYLHDIDFHDYKTTNNPEIDNCKNHHEWDFKRLYSQRSTRPFRIKFKNRFKYKYLCIYYCSYFENQGPTKRYNRTIYSRKNRTVVQEMDIKPLISKGETDDNYPQKSFDTGL